LAKIHYADHLQLRLNLRKIPKNLPKSIYRRAKELFYDNITGNYIAVARARYAGKTREMMVAFSRKNGEIVLITVHPLKPRQKANRIASGRWIVYEKQKKQIAR
jgi:hypothetical protein